MEQASAGKHFMVKPDMRVQTDAYGRISYSTYDDLHIELPQRKQGESLEDYIERRQRVFEGADGHCVTLPTPFPLHWVSIKQDDNLRVLVEEVAVGADEPRRFCATRLYRSPANDTIFPIQANLIHPQLKPVPWTPRQICYSRDYTGPRFPPGVQDMGINDPEWNAMANDLRNISYDQHPHWTLRFKTQALQKEWSTRDLPDFNSDLIDHPDVSHIIFVFDYRRLDNPSIMPTSEIMRVLLARYVNNLQKSAASQEPKPKRRVI